MMKYAKYKAMNRMEMLFGETKRGTILVMVLLSILLCLSFPMRGFAAEQYTVKGTIQKMEQDVIFFSTSDGVMEIKVDAKTQATPDRMLSAGKSATIGCYNGGDGYLHAGTIVTGNAAAPNKYNAATVNGKVAAGTNAELLMLMTDQGIMEIKLEVSTQWNGCNVLYEGKPLIVVCGRGDDAYMHASVISDTGKVENGTVTAGAAEIEGVVASGTNSDILKINTKDGVAEIKLTDKTDISRCPLLAEGRTIKVWVRNGGDGYLHADRLIGSTSDVDCTLDTKASYTVDGVVYNGSTESIMNFYTVGGVMNIKIDASTVIESKALILGKVVRVVCCHASDGYLHATKITAL